jgi:glycosyltransferase involved in cell wall biosynthesis
MIDQHRPSLSVVIPVKDDAVLLERCLEALWDQTERPDEIVVVDNASSDLTPTVATWWETRYVYEAGRGISAAASAGYDVASADIIARLDADSIPAPDWVERLKAAFQSAPDVAAVTGPGHFESLPPAARRLVDFFYMSAYFRLFGLIVGRTPLFGSNFAMRRSTWMAARLRIHRDDPNVHDDLDLTFGLDELAVVRLDPTLRMQVSARPFANPRLFVVRVWRGLYTVAVNRRASAPARRLHRVHTQRDAFPPRVRLGITANAPYVPSMPRHRVESREHPAEQLTRIQAAGTTVEIPS